MRVMALALAGMLAVLFSAGTHAYAAKSNSVANPDRQYYQGAARGCGGGAYCYRSGSQKHSKKKYATVPSQDRNSPRFGGAFYCADAFGVAHATWDVGDLVPQRIRGAKAPPS
jgi:hypothetical protein